MSKILIKDIKSLEPHQIAALAISDKDYIPDLMAIIRNQSITKLEPWDGCYAATPTGPTPWYDGWDPNSRVLVSLLICIGIKHGVWDTFEKDSLLKSANYAIQSEIRQNRIPVTYTNVAISMAVCCIYLGGISQDDFMYTYGETMLQAVTEDRLKRGGFCEFNSPTYLGVSILATNFLNQIYGKDFALDELLYNDLESIWVSEIRDFVGPSSRSYGPSVNSHFSLSLLAIGDAEIVNEYSPPGHREDSVFQAVFDLVKPSTIKKNPKHTLESVHINSIASISQYKSDAKLYLGAGTYDKNSWHHQSTSITIHGLNTAMTLAHPFIKPQISKDKVEWDWVKTNDTGNPAWLWGSILNQNINNTHKPENIAMKSWNIKVIDNNHIKIGSNELKVYPSITKTATGPALKPGAGYIELL
jgi:hypothetical protein